MAAKSAFAGRGMKKTATGPTQPAPGRDTRSSIPCQFFAQRRCPNGENCPFSHGTRTIEQPWTRSQPAAAVRGTASDNITTLGDGRTSRLDDAAQRSPGLGDSRASIPCRFLLLGSCLKGEKCPFSHNLEGNSNDTKNTILRDGAQAPFDTEEASAATSENWSRELNGALVSFGDGAVVTKVSFPSDFSAVRITHLPPGTTAKSVVDLLTSLGFIVMEESVRVIAAAPADTTTMNAMSSADVRVEDPLFAKALCDLPAMKKNNGPRTVPITAPMPSQSTNYRRVDSKKVYCSWHKPTRTAWLNFGNGDIAAKVASRFTAGIYKVLNQAVQCNSPTLGEGFRNPLAWTLRLSDVPGPAKKGDITTDIPKGMVPRHGELSPVSYDVDLPMANALIVSLLLQAGPMERWEGAHADALGKRLKAQALFLNDADARQAVKMFHNRVLPFEGNSGGKLTVQLVHSARLKILNRVYEAIEPEIAEHKPAWASKHLRYRAYDPAQGLRVLKIEGEVSADVASAKMTLERIIQGQVLMAPNDKGGEEEALWAPSFAGAASGRAQQRMRELERELSIVIVRDKRRSQVRLLGPRAKREEARPVLLELAKGELEAARSSRSSATQTTFIIELDGQLFTRAFRGGYRAIASAIGEDKVTLDIVSTPRRIVVTGSASDFKAAQDILRETSKTEPESDPRIACQGEAATCREVITLTSLQEHLSSSALEDLLEASFKAHVTRNLTTLKYCPTPDCEQLYRASSPTPGTETGTLFTCPSCLTAICTGCHISHDGLTCSEHRDQLSGGQEALKKTKQKLGIKDCPKCGIMIEKTDGCNHMTCSACGAHICWVCLETFSRGHLVYDHMTRKHGGIGVEYQLCLQ